MTDQQPLNIEYLLNVMAKLKLILELADERRIRGVDPRFDAIVIKAKELHTKFEKLIPSVMLNEIALFQKVAKELYQTLGEHSDFAIKGEKDSGH